MKNKTLTLTKILIKNGEGFGIRGGKSKYSQLMLFFLIIAIIPALLAFTRFLSGAYNTLFMLGQEGVIISWGISIISLMIFVFGIIYIISSFYLSTDIENLLHIPLRPKQIVGAKFLVVTVYEYLIAALIYFPILGVYGVKSGAGPLLYFYGLVIFLLIPVLPLAVASIIVMLIMRFTNISKHRDAFKLVGGLIAMFFGLGINLFSQRMAVGMTAGDIEELLLRGNNSLVALTTGVFPTVKLATEALLNSQTLSGLSSLVLYTGISVFVYLLLIYLGEMLYFKGVVGISESGSRRNSGKNPSLDKTLIQGSVIKTYTLAEIKLLVRTPIYFLNCVLMNFIWPVLLLFPMLTGSMDISFLTGLGEMLKDPQWAGKGLAAAFGLITFIAGVSPITSTTISREGQGLFVKKYLPVSYKDQITAKVLSGFLIGVAGLWVMIVLAIFLLKLPLDLILIILLMGWLPILLLSYTGILIDLYNPKLDWDSEQKAVKQNLNAVFNMIACVVFGGAIIYPIFIFELSLFSVTIILLGAFGVLNGIMYRLVYTKGVKQFNQLEG